jgi:MFS transporter, DHA1 family, inner membrane transport protein
MIFGNFIFGNLLHKSITKTIIVFLLVYAAVYLLAYYGGQCILAGLLSVKPG